MTDHPTVPGADAALPEKDLGKVVGGGLAGESPDDKHKDWSE